MNSSLRLEPPRMIDLATRVATTRGTLCPCRRANGVAPRERITVTGMAAAQVAVGSQALSALNYQPSTRKTDLTGAESPKVMMRKSEGVASVMSIIHPTPGLTVPVLPLCTSLLRLLLLRPFGTIQLLITSGPRHPRLRR